MINYNGELDEDEEIDDEGYPIWAYSDLGHHWRLDGTTDSYHDFPCDHPEEHHVEDRRGERRKRGNLTESRY